MTKKPLSKTKRKQVTMTVDNELAKQINELSKESGSSVQNILAALVWIGKKAFGRTVKIESSSEQLRLSITAFEEFPKISPLDDK